MAGSEAKIISMLKHKTSTGDFNPLYLGPEQRYVGALRKSNNNNIEEQLLLGVDQIKTSWDEGVAKREHIEFRSTDDPTETGFYILDSYIYGEITEVEKEYFVEENSLCVAKSTTSIDGSGRLIVSDDVYAFEGNDLIIDVSAAMSVDNDAFIRGNTLMFNLNTVEKDAVDDTKLNDIKGDGFITFDGSNMLISTVFIIRKDVLRFKQNDGNILNVSQKITTKKYGSDGVDITKEVITNFL